mmetsp:Transcript_88741/g.246490  ORF Transcript_88741/g.246490 Transcript_88741/m.246490 type:complete len:221 (+) Transcript_88741:583-1245(+)
MLKPAPSSLVPMREAPGEAETQRGGQLQLTQVAPRTAAAEVGLLEQRRVPLELDIAQLQVFLQVQLPIISEPKSVMELFHLVGVRDLNLQRRTLPTVHEDTANRASAGQEVAVAAERNAGDGVVVPHALFAASKLAGPYRLLWPRFPCVLLAVPCAREQDRPWHQAHRRHRLAGTHIVPCADEKAPGSEVVYPSLTIGTTAGDEPWTVVEESPDRAFERL